MKRKYIYLTLILSVGVLLLTQWLKKSNSKISSDVALLALVKNDLKGFENYLQNGGNLSDPLPLIDGQQLNLAEGIVFFERIEFWKLIQRKKIKLTGSPNLVHLSIKKNNPQLLELILNDDPAAFQNKEKSLLHIASENCSDKVIKILHKKSNISWHSQDKNGRTPLTIASENGCVSLLNYWKKEKAQFHTKDGRGISALDILKKKKGQDILQLVEKLEERRPANAEKLAEVNFYKKRVVPKDQIIDRSSLIEPEIRPMDAVETADKSEFAD
ncbi:MAG: ankyrin repeat domain-containing protein [Bacteriovoracaceae bacterium]